MRDSLTELVHARWVEYAIPRFMQDALPNRPDTVTRDRRAYADFQRGTGQRFAELRMCARRRQRPLDYMVENLQLLVLRGLDAPCAMCGKWFGLATWSVGYLKRPERCQMEEQWERLTNLIVTCARCDAARGALRPDVWRDVLAALRADEDAASEDAIDRLIVGMAKVLPGGCHPQVTRELRLSISVTAGK